MTILRKIVAVISQALGVFIGDGFVIPSMQAQEWDTYLVV